MRGKYRLLRNRRLRGGDFSYAEIDVARDVFHRQFHQAIDHGFQIIRLLIDA